LNARCVEKAGDCIDWSILVSQRDSWMKYTVRVTQ
jgi:hypothetical protein